MFGEYGISQLWVEKYRPKTISDYIFKSEELRLVFEEWIRTGELPNVGIYGPAGTGKCLGEHEMISIQIDETKLSAAQLKKLTDLIKK